MRDREKREKEVAKKNTVGSKVNEREKVRKRERESDRHTVTDLFFLPACPGCQSLDPPVF